MIPQRIIDLCQNNPKVACNVQRIGVGVDLPVWHFLNKLETGDKVLVLIKWYGGYVTVILELPRKVFWDQDWYPRLDLKYPEDIPINKGLLPKPSDIDHIMSIWGGFIAAITKVRRKTKELVVADPQLETFMRLAGEVIR